VAGPEKAFIQQLVNCQNYAIKYNVEIIVKEGTIKILIKFD